MPGAGGHEAAGQEKIWLAGSGSWRGARHVGAGEARTRETEDKKVRKCIAAAQSNGAQTLARDWRQE